MKTHRLLNPNDASVQCIQSRTGTSLEKIEEYAGMMASGVQFDPCQGFEDADGQIWIYDGKHRRESAINAGVMLLVELAPGTRQDAAWHATHANTKHGLPRSRNDIVNAVKLALQHPYAVDKSDRELALWCGCDHKTIGKYRKDLEASGEIPQMQTHTITRGEQEYQMEIPVKTKKGLYFDMTFDIDDSGECERLRRTVLASESEFVPLTAQAAEAKGWCHSCPYASSGHYLNENGYKWCTLSIIQDLKLREILKTDKIQIYTTPKPEVPASDVDNRGGLEAEEEIDEDTNRQEAEKEEDPFEARLERCRACVGKHYLVKIDGVLGVTHITEANEHLAKVRGVTYPYDDNIPFPKFACGTFNFSLEDLLSEVNDSRCQYCQRLHTTASEEETSEETAEKPDPMHATAQQILAHQILDTLEQDQRWVNPIVKRFADSNFFPYDTTDMKLFREVTIRKPTGETNRFGDERLKRYRLDGVAVIKINDHRYTPILVGFEVKVDKHDLLNDKKMHEYLDYVDMFFLVIPRTLGVASIDFRRDNPYEEQIGDMIVEAGSVEIHGMPEMLHPGERERQEIVTELLMKALWKEKNQVHKHGKL